MGWFFRCLLFSVVVISSFIIFVPAADAEKLTYNLSTQVLWGDDYLGESQFILAQYLRFGITPDDNKKYSITGYARAWKDFASGGIRDDDLHGRIYYLYMDYSLTDNLSFRLGRQFIKNTAAGSALLDGLNVDVNDVGPVNISLSGGRNVVYSLDSEYSRLGNYLLSIDVYTEKIKSTQLGFSYMRKYDEGDLARERIGMNLRYFHMRFSPYAEVRYDILSEAIDEAVLGIDFFPISNVTVKGEFYHSYPSFDSTSIYSIFAVDKYREYFLMVEYSFDAPTAVFASYARQTYEDSDNADRFTVGTKIFPTEKLSVTASIDYRHGYGGNIWGFEVYGDYKPNKKLLVSAGAQYDTYKRPDYTDDNYDYARRFWLGCKWNFSDKMSLSARLEDNINENFEHQPLGRVVLNWSL